MKLSVLSILVTAVTAAVLPTEKRNKGTSSPISHLLSSISTRLTYKHLTETSASLPSTGYERDGYLAWSPVTIKRAHQGPGPCLSSVECQGGICKDRVCVYDPDSKRDTKYVKREVQGISKDPTCHNDADCEGGSCDNGICTAQASAKRDADYTKREVENISKDPSCHNDVDCEGGSCLNGICTADPPAKRDD